MAKMSPSAWLAAMRPKDPGVVDEGAEEVHGVHHGLARRHAHHGGIVGGMQADQHVVARDRMHLGQRARQHRGADLGAAAAAAHGDGGDGLGFLGGGQRHGIVVGRFGIGIGAKSQNLRMKRRSIQSFQRQIQSPRA
jgi:hypothetical protein